MLLIITLFTMILFMNRAVLLLSSSVAVYPELVEWHSSTFCSLMNLFNLITLFLTNCQERSNCYFYLFNKLMRLYPGVVFCTKISGL